MTQKRFKLSEPNGAYLIDNNKVYAHWMNDDDKIVDLLNELSDKNEQLQGEGGYFERKKCEYFNKYNKKHLENIQLKEENEQLKKEKRLLARFIRRHHDVTMISRILKDE